MIRVLVASLSLPMCAVVSMLHTSLLLNAASLLIKPPPHVRSPASSAFAPWSGAALYCLLSPGLPALLRGDSGLPGQPLQVFLATEGLVVNLFLHYPLPTLSPSGIGWPLYFPAHPSWDTQAQDGEQEFLSSGYCARKGVLNRENVDLGVQRRVLQILAPPLSHGASVTFPF